MNTHTHKHAENASRSAADSPSRKPSSAPKPAPPTRSDTTPPDAPRKPGKPAQKRASCSHSPTGTYANASHNRTPNNTGLPHQLKTGIESLSGYAMDDVRVHYNSNKPAQLQAHAYAQGNHIHLAPGQEAHLPHEAWHVVQQKQGRVAATGYSGNTPINHQPGLEAEASRKGEQALKAAPAPRTVQLRPATPLGKVVQRMEMGWDKVIYTLLFLLVGLLVAFQFLGKKKTETKKTSTRKRKRKNKKRNKNKQASNANKSSAEKKQQNQNPPEEEKKEPEPKDPGSQVDHDDLKDNEEPAQEKTVKELINQLAGTIKSSKGKVVRIALIAQLIKIEQKLQSRETVSPEEYQQTVQQITNEKIRLQEFYGRELKKNKKTGGFKGEDLKKMYPQGLDNDEQLLEVRRDMLDHKAQHGELQGGGPVSGGKIKDFQMAENAGYTKKTQPYSGTVKGEKNSYKVINVGGDHSDNDIHAEMMLLGAHFAEYISQGKVPVLYKVTGTRWPCKQCNLVMQLLNKLPYGPYVSTLRKDEKNTHSKDQFPRPQLHEVNWDWPFSDKRISNQIKKGAQIAQNKKKSTQKFRTFMAEFMLLYEAGFRRL